MTTVCNQIQPRAPESIKVLSTPKNKDNQKGDCPCDYNTEHYPSNDVEEPKYLLLHYKKLLVKEDDAELDETISQDHQQNHGELDLSQDHQYLFFRN